MKKVTFLKMIGGHTSMVRLQGRWHYVSDGGGAGWTEFHEFVRANGIPMERFHGIPSTVEAAFRKYGMTVSTMKRFPVWTREKLLREANRKF